MGMVLKLKYNNTDFLDSIMELMIDKNFKLTVNIKSLIVTSFIAYFCYYISRRGISVLLPLTIKYYHLNVIYIGVILFLFNLFYAIGLPIFGKIVDNIGPCRTFVISIFILSVASVSIAMISNNSLFYLMIFIYCIMGFFQSSGWPSSMKIMGYFKEHRSWGKISSMWNLNTVLGGGFSVLIIEFFINKNFFSLKAPFANGWIACSLVLLFPLLIFIFLKDEKFNNKNGKNEKFNIRRQLVEVDFKVYFAGIIYFFVKMLRYSLIFWLPLMISSVGFSFRISAYISIGFEIGGFLGVLLAGYLLDKYFKNNKEKLLYITFASIVLCLIIQIIFLNINYPYFIVGSIIMLGLSICSSDYLLSNVITVFLGKNDIGKVSGLINGIGSLGQMLSGPFIAVALYFFSWNFIFIIFTLIFIILTILCIKISSQFSIANDKKFL